MVIGPEGSQGRSIHWSDSSDRGNLQVLLLFRCRLGWLCCFQFRFCHQTKMSTAACGLPKAPCPRHWMHLAHDIQRQADSWKKSACTVPRLYASRSNACFDCPCLHLALPSRSFKLHRICLELAPPSFTSWFRLRGSIAPDPSFHQFSSQKQNASSSSTPPWSRPARSPFQTNAAFVHEVDGVAGLHDAVHVVGDHHRRHPIFPRDVSE